MKLFTKTVLCSLSVAAAMSCCSCVNSGKGKSKEGNISGKEITKTVEIGNFNEIKVATGIHVVFSQDTNSGYAEVQTNSNIADRLVVKTEDGVLSVYFRQDEEFSGTNEYGKTTVTVSSNDLSEINVSSAGKLTVKGALHVTNTIDVGVSSAGQVVFGNLNCNFLDIDASSASSIEIQSLTGDLEVDASSASSVEVGSLKAMELEIDASSTALVDIDSIMCSKVTADASSAAKIILAGECRVYNGNKSSNAHITNRLKVNGRK